jgi:uncharacterized membrane protein
LLRVAGHTEREVAAFASGHPAFPLGDLERFVRVDSSTRAIDAVRSVAGEDPQHAPLYYVAARPWALVFGSSIATGRLFAAIIGLGAVAAMYWLCLELFVKTGAFTSHAPCWLGVALVALSPFQVAMAREHREYSMWSLTTILVCAAFLRAVRKNAWRAWAVFSAATAMSLYTHPFSAMVLAACGLWLLACERFRPTQALWRFACACFAAGVAAVPLAMAVLTKRQTAVNNIGWAHMYSQGRMNFRFSIDPVLRVTDSSFWDLIHLADGWPGHGLRILLFQAMPLLVLVALAWFARGKRRASAGFAFAVVCSLSLPLFYWDFITGSTFGWAYRYALPSSLGWLLAGAFLSAVMVGDTGHWLEIRRALVTLFLLIAAISAASLHAARIPWVKTYFDNGETVDFLNDTAKIALVSDEFVGDVLALLPSVRPDLPLVWTPRCYSCPLADMPPVVQVPPLPAGFPTILYFRSWVNVGIDPTRNALSADHFNDPGFHSYSVVLPTGQPSLHLFLLTAIP